MKQRFNPHISVDCVVFGFDNEELKVLLVKRSQNSKKYKLPGDLIVKMEILSDAANRILKQFTGLENIFVKQFGVFDDPERLETDGDMEWLRQFTKMDVDRVVTIAYYSLVKLDQSKQTQLSIEYGAKWFPVKQIPDLIFDHEKILHKAFNTLKKEFLTDPLCFELLPKLFPLNQLQKLSESILDIKLDNRNFRKKVTNIGYIVPTGEKQKNVKHKPAMLYMFDRKIFEDIEYKNTGFII
jgi:hypothetical protein